MRIAFNEIWNFLNLLDTKEKGWTYALQAGKTVIEQITTETMLSLKKDEHYDTELLPSIFTFREILWQPDVFNEAGMSLPSLRILEAYCKEVTVELEEKGGELNKVYAHLLRGLGKCSGKAVANLDKERVEVKKVLGDFRTCAFPIVKFFVYHPMNRRDYFIDAVNRLNYAVKIMLTQFYGRYTELDEPYWVVSFNKPDPASKKLVQEVKEQ
ncbi:MAG: hypothetical protein GDA51_07080 [Ekhidna sp.]|nr:hypothetical protein [Ekhidna sp.]MBC6410236.1 hypothetical protein [Ekhidna sp.]MBC6426221.1 hypothetical protein [Ekhidna sp.]